jgi:phosphoribosylglycinamide formyltransferase-1
MTKKVVIFASGSGSNAENIIQFFNNDNTVNITSIFCNKEHAGVIDRAKKYNIPVYIFSKSDLLDGKVLNKLNELKTTFVVLAGFLLQLPQSIIQQYPNKIINIHPALLPKYGGKGMYGSYVHEAVINNRETETGITIHYVNENYDEGAIIFQKSVSVTSNDTPESVAQKVHELEYAYFPITIQKLLKS